MADWVEVEVVIASPDRAAVLVRDDRLPELRVSGGPEPQYAELPAAVLRETGLVTTLLEPLEPTVFVLEPHGGEPASGYRWADAATVPHVQVRRWLARPASQTAWFRPGWWDQAIAWIDTVLPGRTGPVVQVQHWSMSCVLRVPMGDGVVYFKAVRPELAREPSVIAALAASAPGSVPEVLAHSAVDGWWLSADFGSTAGPYLAPAERAGALTALAELQLAAVGQVDAYAAAGCPVVTADTLAERVPGLMARVDLWADPGRAAPPGRTFTPAERLRWAEFGMDLQDRCADLGDLGLPLTVTHGDFHPNNVVRRDAGFLLYDWSFAAVSYPLLDLAAWLHGESAETVAAQHVARYTDGWRDAKLRAAWRVARPVGALVELLKFVDLAELAGPDHAVDYLPMAYAWARRLVAAVDGTDANRIGW